MAKRITVSKVCKFCGVGFEVRTTVEDAKWLMNCCKPCWDDDAPGMARFERMQATMGTTFAIDHS